MGCAAGDDAVLQADTVFKQPHGQSCNTVGQAHAGQTGAVAEGPLAQIGYAVGDVQAGQAFAVSQRGVGQGGYAVRQSQAGQTGAREGVISDAGDAIRKGDASQRGTGCECIPGNGGQIPC